MDLPRTRQAAKQVAGHVKQSLANMSPATELATVADTSHHTSVGYVVATTTRGPIHVYGVPFNTVCSGMRIFVRKMTKAKIGYHVFDGYAPQIPVAATSSGSVATIAGPAASLSPTYGGGVVGSGSPLITIPTTTPFPSGWYWSFFWYLSGLPPASNPCVLLDMPLVNSWSIAGGFRIVYNYLGQLGAYFYTWPETPGSSTYVTTIGSFSTTTFAPHRVWWSVFQLGKGLMVNGQPLDTSISNLTGAQNMQAGYYSLFLLSDSNGQNWAPAGSWISKVSVGCDAVSGTIYQPYGSVIPTSDSAMVNESVALDTGLTTYGLWLMEANPIPSLGVDASSLSVLGSLLVFGPY